MKKITLLMLTLCLLLTAVSCASAKYADDKAITDLANLAFIKLSDAVHYSVAEEGYLDDYFSIPSYVSEYQIQFATDGNNLNEFGFFHVTEGNADSMEALLKDYLTRSYEKNQAWYDSYIPAETPKLRDAQVKVFGNYVVYAIATDEDRAAMFDAVDQLLTLS